MTRIGAETEQERLAREVARWKRRAVRPARIAVREPGQESVWDYPRPPRVERVSVPLHVKLGNTIVAETDAGLRVVETAGAPVYYFPPDDVNRALLHPSQRASWCEWKGEATYWTVRTRERAVRGAAWSYRAPYPTYSALAGHFAFYANELACYVGAERVRPQPGGLYGGWVTRDLAGPIKGAPGTECW